MPAARREELRPSWARYAARLCALGMAILVIVACAGRNRRDTAPKRFSAEPPSTQPLNRPIAAQAAPPPNPTGPLADCACDGRTNDSACIQRALATLGRDAPTLSFPEGKTCRAWGLSLQGAHGSGDKPLRILGNGSTLKAPDTAPVAAGDWLLSIRESSHLIVDGLTFDGNREAREKDHRETDSHALNILASRELHFTHLNIVNSPADGVYVAALANPLTGEVTPSEKITFEHPVVEHSWRNNFSIIHCLECSITGDGNFGPSGDDGSQASCRITDAEGHAPGAGVDLEPNVFPIRQERNLPKYDPAITSFRIEGCFLARNRGSCIQLSAPLTRKMRVNFSDPSRSDHTLIVGNLLEACRGADIGRSNIDAAGIAPYHAAEVRNNRFIGFDLSGPVGSLSRSIVDFGATEKHPATDQNKTFLLFIENSFGPVRGLDASHSIIYIHGAASGGVRIENNDFGPSSESEHWCDNRAAKSIQPSIQFANNKTARPVDQVVRSRIAVRDKSLGFA